MSTMHATVPVEAKRVNTHSGSRIFWISMAALLLRIALIFAFHTYRTVDTPNHHSFAFETGSIAGSLATGRGFSSPFGDPTGPTAWLGPLYPSILAGAFLLFGVYSKGAAITMLVFNSVCAALTVPFIYRIARRVFDETTALTSAWIWAVVPFFARWPVTWIWETSLSALLCAAAFWVSLELESEDWRPWAGFGILWGVIALGSPAVLSTLPALLLYPAWRLRHHWSRALRNVGVAVLFLVVCVAPWLARNARVLQRPVLRTNFWVEVNLSNYHGSTGEAWRGRHPAGNPDVLKRYAAEGEVQFADDCKRQVFEFVRANPAEFAKLVIIRIVDFWDGGELNFDRGDDPFRPWMILLTSVLCFGGLVVAFVNRSRWVLFAWTLLLFPLPYYLTYTYPRYRHPIEPVMAVLIGFVLVELSRWCRVRVSSSRTA